MASGETRTNSERERKRQIDDLNLEKLFRLNGLPFRLSTTEEDLQRGELGALCVRLAHSSPDDEDWEVSRVATGASVAVADLARSN